MKLLLPEEVATFDRGGWPAVTQTRAASAGQDFVQQVFAQLNAVVKGTGSITKPYEQSEWIHACVYAIAHNLSTLPLVVYSGTPQKPIVDDSGPVADLMQEPIPNTPREEWVFSIAVWMLLRGEAFIVPKLAGQVIDKPVIPDELSVVSPTAIREKVQQGQLKAWQVGLANKQTLDLNPDFVIHPREWTPYSQWRGLGKAQVAAIYADQSYRAAVFNSTFLANGADPGGILSYKNKLTDTQRKGIEKTFADKYEGAEKVGKTMLLDGDAAFQFNPRTQRDMQFMEGQAWNRDVICGIFGVPKTIVSVTDSINFATKVAEEAAFWERAVLPIGRRICSYFNIWFRRRLGLSEWIGFDHSGVEALQDRVTEKTAAATALATLGVPFEDVNAKLGLKLPPRPWYGEAWTQGQPTSYSAIKAAEDASALATETAGAPVQDTAMNGAQVASMQAIVQSVSDGLLPADSAAGMLAVAFPTLTPEQIAAIVAPAGLAADAKKAEPPAPAGFQQTQATPPNKPDGSGATAQTQAAGAGPDTQAPRIMAPHVRVLLGRDEKRSLRQDYQKRIILPAERRLAKIGTRHFRQCKADVMRIFDSREFGLSDIHAIEDLVARWDERIAELFRRPMQDVVSASAGATAQEVGFTTDLDFNDPRWVKIQRDRLDLLSGVDQTLVDDVRSRLVKGITDGLSNSELRQSLLQVFAGDHIRALRVARTEVGALASSSRDEVFTEAEIAKIEWVTSADDAVRLSHVECDGQVIDRGGTFHNGLHYPHDPLGDAAEVINCRCDHVAAD